MDPESDMQTLTPSGNDGPRFERSALASITKDEVLEVVHRHKRFSTPSVALGAEVTDLPNLDDITQYEVSEEAQGQLWAKEVTRLVDVVTSPTPLTFEGSGRLAVDSERSYEMLADMANCVWQAMQIAIFDGESLIASHCEDLRKPDILKSSRLILDHLCDDQEDNILDHSGEGIPPHSREDLFDFVNYCTAVLARVLCGSAGGMSFHVNVLATLAKLSTKVKVVSIRLRECAQTSIDNGIPDRMVHLSSHPNFRGRQGNNPRMGMEFGGIDIDFEPPIKGMRGLGGELARSEPSSKKDSLRKVYFLQCTKYRNGIFRVLDSFLASLPGTNSMMRKSVTSYELCSMVYGTGFERFRTLVHQNRKNDLSGTSDASMVNCARNSFDLLDKTVRHVQSSASPHSLPRATTLGDLSGTENQLKNIESRQNSVGTRISWSYTTDENSTGSVQTHQPLILRSMSQVITVMIPLIMTSPAIVHTVDKFITTAIFAEPIDERVMNPIKPRVVGMYTAFFCLTTAEYDAAQRSRGPEDPGSLSKALMRRNNLLARRQLADISRQATLTFDPNDVTRRTSPDGDDQTMPELIQRRQRELDSFSNQMKDWVLEEKGVMVRCRLFVWVLMLLCAMLVTGGVSIGVAVGERITGVDPFNITTYCWVLAAFILLVAKSVRVQSWPWNDFLHGRVLCKSVSELSSVTGVKEHLILAKLLQDESISILQTRGPYNTVFTRKSEDGFSIDRPLSTWTMLLSGLIMIEVDTAHGRGLVCLDLRRGTKFRMIQNMCTNATKATKVDELIHCARLPNDKGEETHGDPNRIRLDKGNLVWLRTLGFYRNKKAEFI